MPMKTMTTDAPATPAQLHHQLDAGQALAATYGGRMSNHLPMAQQALVELGVSASRLQAFTELQQASLAPRCAAPVPRIEIERDLGRAESDEAWRVHFTARTVAHGVPATLLEAMALLLPGAGAIAFHGLIRTGHAVLAGHQDELASGLAHWAAHFMPLATLDGPPLALADWLQALRSLPRPAYPAGSFIADRMQAWGETASFAAVAGRLLRGPDSLRDIALLAARTYAATGNFTVLHLLTASHAMAVLEPYWPGQELPRGFVVAAAAGLLASGAAPALAQDGLPSRHWPALISAACAQGDAHVIKLTHAAWRLDRRWPNAVWRQAVERAVPG